MDVECSYTVKCQNGVLRTNLSPVKSEFGVPDFSFLNAKSPDIATRAIMFFVKAKRFQDLLFAFGKVLNRLLFFMSCSSCVDHQVTGYKYG